MRWVLLRVGCLACREATEVLGLYDSEKTAIRAFEKHAVRLHLQVASENDFTTETSHQDLHTSVALAGKREAGHWHPLQLHMVPR